MFVSSKAYANSAYTANTVNNYIQMEYKPRLEGLQCSLIA